MQHSDLPSAVLPLRLPIRFNPYVLAGGSRVGVQIVSLLTMMTAVARLDPATFGAFSMGWLVTVIGNTLLYAGLYQYLLRSRELDVDQHVVFWAMLLEGAAISLGMLLAGWLTWHVGNRAVATSLLALAPLTLLSAASAWCDALLTRQQRTAAVGVIYLLAELAGTLALIAGLSAGLRLGALLGGRLACGVAALLGLASAAGVWPRLRWSAASARAAFQEAAPLQGGTLVRTLAIYAADYLLAFFLNPAASASYRAASRVAVAGADIFLQPLRPMTWEALARHERADEHAAMASVYLEQLRFLTFFAAPVLAGVALFSERLFGTFAAAGWATAAPVLVLLALARVPSMFDFFLDPVLVCTGRTGLQFRLRSVQTALVLSGVALTAGYGPVAVASWQLFCSVSVAVLAIGLVGRLLHLRLRPVLGAVGPALASTLVCCGGGELVFRILPLDGPLRLLASIAAMAGCLLLCCLFARQRGLLRLPRY